MPERSPNDPIQIVGIGASAGGLEALGRFFEGVPPESGLAYVVILHLDPDRESHLAEILDRSALIPVREATESVEIEPNRAYVISPHSQLALSGNSLAVEEMPPERPRTPVDHFFFSLAEEQEAAAVGVVLSGTGRDGSLGLRAIREKGGITAAQDPEEAEYSEMPRNAITEGRAELVLPAAGLAPEILEIVRRDGLGSKELDQLTAETRSVLAEILAKVGSEVGHDLRRYKRSTLLRRLDRRMRLRHIDTPEDYARLLEDDNEEQQALFQDFLISVSHFFRDPEAFEVLEQRVVPELFEGKGREDQVRAWVPGCATGEEAYSVAILLHERAATLEDPPEIQVFATDIDQQALSFARRAHYPESVAADVPEERLAHFFDRDPAGYRVTKYVRATVLFAEHGVLSDPPFSNLDLVSCRNLLIYLEPSAQKEAAERFYYGLRPGGYLFLGSAESVAPELFQPLARKERIYRRLEGEGAIPVSRPLPGRSRPLASDREIPKHRGAPDASWEGRHERLLREHWPPNLLIDSDRQVRHLSDGAGRYLRHPGGDLTSSLLDLVRESFVPALRTALYRAFRNGVASTTTVAAEIEGETRTVDVTVHPSRMDGVQCALVVFEEAETTADAEPVAVPESMDLRELQAELEETRDQLQTTIADREATIQDLQSANEELQSVNEEHQATAEELETRSEELQSTNEELTSVNEEHRSAIEEVNRVNADLENLMESTKIATVFLDEDLHVRRFTESATDLFDLLPSDEGRPFQYVTHHLELEERVEDDIRKVLDTSATVEREVWDERGRCYVMAIRPYRSQQNRVTGAVITCFDITERKRMEEDLHEASVYAESIVETLHEPLLVLTPDLRVKSANPAFYEHFDLDPNATTGQLIYELGNDQWDIPALRELLEDVLPENNGFDEFEVKHDFENIGHRVMLLNGRRLDHVQLILLGIRDITERKREEEELREAKRAAESANRTKTEFMGTISHELRTPLNAIIGYTDLLMEGIPEPVSPGVDEQVQRIAYGAHHLRQLISEILTFSRLEAGRESVEEEEVPLPELLKEIRAVIEPLTADRPLRLILERDHAPDRIRTDPRKLRQILVNLLGNAVKFTDEGEVSLRISEEDGRLLFQISDTGPGIEKADREQLFEPFWQGDTTSSGSEGGTGLGLTISLRYAEMLGGELNVESTPGEGSTFTLSLPRRAAGA